MSIKAVLTYGWECQEGVLCASEIDSEVGDQKNYSSHLSKILSPLKQPVKIDRVDALFRRRPDGFVKINRFMSALNKLDIEAILYIDAFAYNLLKSAKNYDFFLYEDMAGHFRKILPTWKKEIKKLENFERYGKSNFSNERKEQYVKFRNLFTRNARDEIRALIVFLQNGPSTLEEVSIDLGMKYVLSERVIKFFEDIQIVRKQNISYVIKKQSIPIVLFALRIFMGMDFLKGIEK